MNYSGSRRHYRVAQKEVEAAQENMLTSDRKKKYMLLGAVLLLVSFLKGLVIGLLLEKRR